MPAQENDLAVGRAPIPKEVCSPPRAHVPKYPSRPRTCARARPDFRVFAVLLPFPCCATDIGSVSDSNTSQMDVDTQHNSETDSDYNPDPNDFVNFVADMYQTPGPGAGQHGPICYGWERG